MSSLSYSSTILIPQPVTVFWDRTFKEVIKFIKVGPYSKRTGVLTKGRRDIMDGHANRKGHVRVWREGSRLQSKERGCKRNQTLQTPSVWTVSLQICKKINFCCLSHSICGIQYFVTTALVDKENKLMKRWQISLDLRKMEIKTTMIYYYTLNRMTTLKRLRIWQGCGALGTFRQ